MTIAHPMTIAEVQIVRKIVLGFATLLGVLMFFAGINFFSGLTGNLIMPLVLTMTDAQGLGLISSIVGIAMLLGTLFMSWWGGPKKKINGLLFTHLDYAAIGRRP